MPHSPAYSQLRGWHDLRSWQQLATTDTFPETEHEFRSQHVLLRSKRQVPRHHARSRGQISAAAMSGDLATTNTICHGCSSARLPGQAREILPRIPKKTACTRHGRSPTYTASSLAGTTMQSPYCCRPCSLVVNFTTGVTLELRSARQSEGAQAHAA